MAKKLTKLLTLGVMAIMLFSLTACGAGQEVEFTIGTASSNGSEKSITKIIDSLDRLSDSDVTGIINIDEKYDADFFASNSLVIVAFATRTAGSQIEKITLTKKRNRLDVDINGHIGLMSMVDQVVVALEVTKENIDGAKTVKFTTNLNKI